VDGLDAGTLIKILAAPAGILLTFLYLRRWNRRRHHEVQQLVSEGQADWAAVCRVTHGAELLADTPPTPRADHASGTLLTTREHLEWHPDTWSLDAGWTPGTRPLTDVRLLSSSWRRDIIGVQLRVLHIEVPGGKVIIAVSAEAGHPPTQVAD
jgi:hypothetical protein